MTGRLRSALAKPTLLLQCSAVLTLVALGLMVWSMLAPTPMPVMLAMTGGQALGTIAFALYAIVVIQDFRRARREKQATPDGDGGDAS